MIKNLNIEREYNIKYRNITLIDIKNNQDNISEFIKTILKFEEKDNSKIQIKTLEVLSNMQKYIIDGTANIIGAFDNEKIIGLIWMYKIEKENMHINYFCVNKNYRNMGIGRKLLELSKEYAQKNKIKDIELRVSNNNINAANFYKKNGFKENNGKLLLEVD